MKYAPNLPAKLLIFPRAFSPTVPSESRAFSIGNQRFFSNSQCSSGAFMNLELFWGCPGTGSIRFYNKRLSQRSTR